MTNIELLPNQIEFDNLAAYLRKKGYTIQITNGQEISVANIEGQGITGGFAVSHWGNYVRDLNVSAHILNRITFDKTEWFDKYSTCTYSMLIPTSNNDRKAILNRMQELRDRDINNFIQLVD